jgi:predicted nucleic acid-binding protein
MICVDASVAVKWILAEPLSDLADALYAWAAREGEQIFAPPLLPYEVANVPRQRMIREARPLIEAERLVAGFLAFRLDLLAPTDLHRKALALADACGLPAIYVAHYLALAQRLGCDLWTDDQELLRRVRGHLRFVRWLGDFTTPNDGVAP